MLGVSRLQLLREVSRRGTMSAASAAMCVTPSAVSQQLALLEREAGTELLEKTGRRVRLTDAGELLVRHADVVLAAIAAAESDLAAMRDVVSGMLRVAAFPTAARAIMPSVMAALGNAHPALRVTLRDLEASESLVALRMDEVDVAIVDEYDQATRVPEDGVETQKVLRDALYFALPPGHRLAGSEVSLKDLQDEFWIMDTESSRLFQVTLQACRAAGVSPRIRSHCKDYSVILALIEAGLGVGVLPGLALCDRSVQAVIRPTNPMMVRDVVAVVRPEHLTHPGVASMLAELARVGQGYGTQAAS